LRRVAAADVKRAFKYRFCPTDAQAAELSRIFGCVRKVYNLELAARTQAWTRQERVKYPRFKSRKKSRASAEHTRSAFTFRGERITLAKMSEPLNIVWSRSLPEGTEPATVTVSRFRDPDLPVLERLSGFPWSCRCPASIGRPRRRVR
jgi:putative transposase